MDATIAQRGQTETARYQQKRDLIVEAASNLITKQGVKGMTLTAVGEVVGLNTTSITYYYKRKELLAAACFHHALDRLDALVDEAACEPDPKQRVLGYVRLQFELLERVRRGDDQQIIALSDILALTEPMRSELSGRYQAIFSKVRNFFGPIENARTKRLYTARAHVLLEVVMWVPAWLTHFEVDDFRRVYQRLFAIFEHGIAVPGAVWNPQRSDFEAQLVPGQDSSQHNFLVAATRLINERGYRGASVERIASHLNVTKGSFYHHHDAKDDLVLDCFRNSFNTLAIAINEADLSGGSAWQKLASTTASLLDIQLSERAPLLRTTALHVLPLGLRTQVIARSDRLAMRLAGLIVDGMVDESIRALDPYLASQALMAMFNAAYVLHGWAARQEQEAAIATYASTLMFGLFSDETASEPR